MKEEEPERDNHQRLRKRINLADCLFLMVRLKYVFKERTSK